MLLAIGGFLALAALEIILGIDNMLVIAIMSGRLPKHQRAKARYTGLLIAVFTRVGLLCGINWIIGLTATVFSVMDHSFSWRDMILFAGGLFLLWKSAAEIHATVETIEEHGHAEMGGGASIGFASCVAQIVLLDIVFSLDSVITAVGLARDLYVMIAAVVAGALAMMVFTGPVGDFIHRNPSIKVLALAFLTLIGTTLILESFHVDVPKGYVYCSMGFAFSVELLHLRRRKNIARVNSRAIAD